ncbi:hypothetical protein PVAND_001969 [Polypedilum vanderplanki]|uniref:Uncharacterized protein n=1 Tax=Polypedilum vanderplanki TaxID=319348 RepID=A0A9J6BPJ5_POLVA|nr:hypothetical protein PVAND_001969 [Polypedilum vanderplanki]
MKNICIFILIGFLYSSPLQVSAQHNVGTSRDQRFFDITTAITNILNQLISTVSNTLNAFLNSTGSSILGGINTIENAVNQAISDFMQQIEDSRTEFENLITEELAHCFENMDIAFLNAKNETINGIFGCYNNSREIFMSISENIAIYGQNNSIIILNLKTKLDDCINTPAFEDKIKCAVELSAIIKITFIGLSENIANTANNIKDKIYSSINGSLTCIDEKLTNGQTELEQTLEDVRQCLQDADRYSTTTSTTEDSTQGNEENSTVTNEEDSTVTNEGNSSVTNEENSTLNEESSTQTNEQNSSTQTEDSIIANENTE